MTLVWIAIVFCCQIKELGDFKWNGDPASQQILDRNDPVCDKGHVLDVLDWGKVIIIQSSISTFIPNNVANITIFVKMKEDILNAIGGKHFQTMNVEEMES